MKIDKSNINNGNTYLHLAAAKDDFNLIINFYDFNDFKIINNDGYTPLHILINFCYFETLFNCVLKHPSLVNIVDKDNCTILHVLAENDNYNYEFLDKILKIKSISELIDFKILDRWGYTLLNKIVGKGDIDSLKLLPLKKINLNYPDYATPLLVAIINENYRIVKYLINGDFNLNINFVTSTHTNGLVSSLQNDVMSKCDECKITKLLLNNDNIDASYSGSEGEYNPILLALKIIDIHPKVGNDILSLILKAKPSFTKYDKLMNTPVHYALKSKYINSDNLKNILSHSELNNKNINGETSKKLLCGSYNDKKLNDVKKKYCNRSYPLKNNNRNFKFINKELIGHISKNVIIFNSDTLHNIIYTIILLIKYDNVGVPFKINFKEKLKFDTRNSLYLNCLSSKYKNDSNVLGKLLEMYILFFYEISSYLIIWKNEYINHIDDSIELYLKRCLSSKNIRFIVLKLTIIVSNSGSESTHANMLIYDKINCCIERFEPYGTIPYSDSDNLDIFINDKLCKIFTDLNVKCEYIPPKIMFKNNVSFQSISRENEVINRKTFDADGYCLAWTFWYLEQRVNNPDKKSYELIELSLDSINSDPNDKKFINFIRNYAGKLDQLKNKFMENAGIEKDEIYNRVFKIETIKKIKNKIITEFYDKIIHRYL